jgi:tRNA(fMet)-specific endonuclease VapC
VGLILDTSLLVAEERGRFRLWDFCEAHYPDDQLITAITVTELLHGVERAKPGPLREQRRRKVEGVLANFTALSFDAEIARLHAEVWARLTVAGTPIGPHDLIIAAIALHHGFALATLNTAEFQRVPGLVLADVQPYVITPA